MKKIKALAKFLGIETKEIEEDMNNHKYFKTEDGEEYMVLTDDEAEDEFYNYESDLIEECGFDAFSV